MEIEIKFNEVFNAPMGSPRPRLEGHAHTYMPTNYTKHKKYLQSQMPRLNLRKCIKNPISVLLYST